MDNTIFESMLELESQHWWFVARRKIISTVIKNTGLSEHAKILDTGCGNGDNLSLLSEFGDVVAIEKDANAAERAKQRKIVEIHQGHLPDNIPDNISKDFDLIVLLDVLEHIEDDKESLISIGNLLDENGTILITVPAYQFLWTKHDELHHHKRRYSKTAMKKLLSNSGFDIRYISYFNTLLFPLALIDRLKLKLFPSSEAEVLSMPASWLNNILEKVFSLECYLINKLSLPFGLSIIAVATRVR